MGRSFVILALLSVVLSGCGIARAARERNERDASLQSALALCQSGAFKTNIEKSTCIGNAEEMYLLPGTQAADLFRVKIATRNALAAKLDAGTITKTEADLEMAKVTSQLTGEMKRRFDQDRSVQAQQSIADSARRQSAPVTCMGGPNIVSCF